MSQSADQYLTLPYTIEVTYDDSGEQPGWFAKVVELPGCMTQADAFEELEWMIQDAMRAWIEVSLEDGLPVPLPQPPAQRDDFTIHVKGSLYSLLAKASQRQGTSMDALVNDILAKAVMPEKV